ncbi:MAG: hypothetical protein M1813_001052 [Trichoglossum hirsutum]|nr:MAG: hypothetical protein M1813_001052 [Trichoglossum hirsutum]
MDPMDYEMESPVAIQRGIHPGFAMLEQREHEQRQFRAYQSYIATQRLNFERSNVDALPAQHYRPTNNPGTVPMSYDGGLNQSIHQNNASMNPQNPPFFQNIPGPQFSDLEAVIAAHPILTRSLHQASNFQGQRSYQSAATASTTYLNPTFFGPALVPTPTESNQMEYSQTPPPNWGMQPVATGSQYQSSTFQLESFHTQNYPGMPEFEYTANPAFHDQSIPSPGPGIPSNNVPDLDPSTAHFGTYQQTHPSTSYASVLASLETQNDMNANIAQFRDTVIPGSSNSISRSSHSDAEVAAAIDVYFRTGEFQRVMDERLLNDELADPGRPLQDFEAFLERLPRSALQRQPNRPLWTESRHRTQQRSPSGPSREMNQANQARTRNTDPLFVAHIPSAQIQRDTYPRRPPVRAFERATVKAISGLLDVPIGSLPKEDRTCSICMDPFGEVEPTGGTSETPVKLPCGHIFGYACIKTWLKEHCTCPACRRKLESEIVHSSPSYPSRERVRNTHRLSAERSIQLQPNDSPHPTNSSDRTVRVRAPRRERDSGHNTTANRYEGATSRTHNMGPSDVNYISQNDITPTVHPRIGFARSRSNAFSTRTFPSAARALYSTLNDDSEIDHPRIPTEGSMRQQLRRRDGPLPFQASTVHDRFSTGLSPTAPIRNNPPDPTRGHPRMGYNSSSNSNFQRNHSIASNTC